MYGIFCWWVYSQSDWVTAVCLLRASKSVFTPWGAVRQKELSFCSPHILIPRRLLSNWRMRSHLHVCMCVLFCTYALCCKYEWEGWLAGCFHCSVRWIISHLCSVCYVCLVRDPRRTPDSSGAARVTSQMQRQVGAFLYNFSKKFLQYL